MERVRGLSWLAAVVALVMGGGVTAAAEVQWRHLSSRRGELPAPGESTQQTGAIVADLDRDGVNDFVLSFRQKAPALVWYRRTAKGWDRYVIEKEYLTVEAGGAVYDIDGDGYLDVVFGGDWQSNQIWWWRNPGGKYDPNVSWERRTIKKSGATQHHDQCFADLKGTGKAQLAYWNQGAKKLFVADIPARPREVDEWPASEVFSGSAGENPGKYAEGMSAHDIDGDGKVELLAGNHWVKWLGNDKWQAVKIGEVGGLIYAEKLIKDSKYPQVVIAAGDGVGPVKWYECTGDPAETKSWVGHDLLGREAIHAHSLQVADIDGDGNLDVFVAEMAKWSENKTEPDNPQAGAWVFYGDGKGGFRKTVFATGMGFHEARVADLDGDGKLDILNKPYNWDVPRVDVWLQRAAGVQIPVIDALVIGDVARGGRSMISVDAVQSMMVSGSFRSPKAGDRIGTPGGRAAQWRSVTAKADGWFDDAALRGGYLFATVTMPAAGTMVLEAAGDSMVYVNGEPRAGDPYAHGYLQLPVRMKAGENDLLFLAGRGRVRAKLVSARANVMPDTGDATLPDVLTSDVGKLLAGVLLINANDGAAKDLMVRASCAGAEAEETALPMVSGLSIRKVPVGLPVPRSPQEGQVKYELKLVRAATVGAEAVDEATITLRVRSPKQTHKRTFISRIDGSVQYYAVNPAQKPGPENALVLTLHGASVEALGQASAYGSKDWVTLVAPTNRRPYGFDWEDIGRLDAMEVLELAEASIPHDPQRVSLTGHSMGGHGTWHLGVTFPDRFASIGPSAGWSSFFSYGGGRRATSASVVETILARAAATSDTLTLTRNTLMQDVYILHGEADDNVPVSEARLMRDNLKAFHPRLLYHEQPGAGHWWGGGCVDWPPMFEMFAKARLPRASEVREIEFTTANPGVSGTCHWVTIEQQREALRPSTVRVRREGELVAGTTSNVVMLTVNVELLGSKVAAIDLDGQRVAAPASKRVTVVREGDRWRAAGEVGAGVKCAARSGPFKQVFGNRVMFVYGTRGSVEERAWSERKARYDAETFYYRGNGAVDVMADEAANEEQMKGRNVVLYGNAETNGAWGLLMRKCPIQVRGGAVEAEGRRLGGDDLACVVVYPKPDDAGALVGVVGGTGLKGMRLADRLPLFVSFVGYPDWLVVGAESLEQGVGGVRGAGFFGNDWRLDAAQSFWKE